MELPNSSQADPNAGDTQAPDKKIWKTPGVIDLSIGFSEGKTTPDPGEELPFTGHS